MWLGDHGVSYVYRKGISSISAVAPFFTQRTSEANCAQKSCAQAFAWYGHPELFAILSHWVKLRKTHLLLQLFSNNGSFEYIA